MKYVGIALLSLGFWWGHALRNARFLGFGEVDYLGWIGVAVGFFLLLEGIRREIIENLERIFSDKTNDLWREMKKVSHLVALHATVQEEGTRGEIRSALKGIPAQQRTETIDIEQADE